MISPTSKRPTKKRERKPYVKDKPSHPFYTRAAWRRTRKAYIQEYIQMLRDEVPKGYVTIKQARLPLEPYQQTKILSMFAPCEKCVKMYVIGAQYDMSEGEQVDHIDPINPDNPLESDGWGNPFDRDNLQLLCHRHHAKKTAQVDQKIIKLKKQ